MQHSKCTDIQCPVWSESFKFNNLNQETNRENKHTKSRNTKENARKYSKQKKQQFEKIEISYKKISANWIKLEQKLKQSLREKNKKWHTKTGRAKQNLHLDSDYKKIYRNRLTIINGSKFINEETTGLQEYWLSRYVTQRGKNRTYYIIMSEFGKREFIRNSTKEWEKIEWHWKHA